jgi:DNA-binding protein YbaB
MRLEWQAHIDEMLQQYRQVRDRLGDAQRQISELTSTVASEDGLVTVTVDHQGDLVDLQLNPRVYRVLDPLTLGETIVETTKRAVSEVRQQAKDLMTPLLPPNTASADPADPTGGGLLSLLPQDPTDLSRFQGSRP